MKGVVIMEKKPLNESYQPNIVHGGYQPSSPNQTTATVVPPSGGSNVNPPQKAE